MYLCVCSPPKGGDPIRGLHIWYSIVISLRDDRVDDDRAHTSGTYRWSNRQAEHYIDDRVFLFHHGIFVFYSCMYLLRRRSFLLLLEHVRVLLGFGVFFVS